MTRFSKLDASGKETEVREIPQSAMLKCPHYIMVADHYREDGSCRCDDKTHTQMRRWGYKWRAGSWQ